MRQISYILLALTLTAVACGNIGKKKRANIVTTYTTAPAFDADSAFSFVKAQTDFGPRVPNTPAHKACAGWLENKLASFGATTIVQQFRTVTFDNTQLECYNIIGQINPDNPVRIILCAHWDSRPWADNDPDPANRNTPIDGANDGASGVGVILEIARQLQIKAPAIGVDCIFFDAEDWGPGDDYTGDDGNYWGLGSQYWAANPHKEGYIWSLESGQLVLCFFPGCLLQTVNERLRLFKRVSVTEIITVSLQYNTANMVLADQSADWGEICQFGAFEGHQEQLTNTFRRAHGVEQCGWVLGCLG